MTGKAYGKAQFQTKAAEKTKQNKTKKQQ